MALAALSSARSAWLERSFAGIRLEYHHQPHASSIRIPRLAAWASVPVALTRTYSSDA